MEQAPEPDRMQGAWLQESRIRLVLAVVALYGLTLLASIRSVVDNDLFWHLRTAQWILEHRGFPVTDPFSRAGETRPWVAYSWLFELIEYGAYRLGSWQGILALRLLLSVLFVSGLHRLARKSVGPGALAPLLAGLGVVAVLITFADRPWLFSAILLGLVLEGLVSIREGRWGVWGWVLPPLFALWANLHVQFIYGLMLMGLAVLDPGVASRRRVFMLAAACALATLLNPYTWRVYEVIREYASQKGAFLYVEELQSMDFRTPPNWIALALMAAGVFGLGRKAKTEPFELLLMGAAAILAIRARRDVWFSTQVALLYLGPALPTTKASLTALPEGVARALIALEVVACLAIVGVVDIRLGYPTREQLDRDMAAVFPVAAVAEVKAKGYPGPLYNHFDWGGFLIWSLPELRVSMDGRTNLHGDLDAIHSLETWDGTAAAPDPELESARLVIGDRTMPLMRLLEHDPHFQNVYEDHLAEVFVRR